MTNERKPPPPPGRNPFGPVDPSYRHGVKASDDALTPRDGVVERVAQELGASPAEAATAARETRSSMTKGEAALELGDPVAVERARGKLPYEIGKQLAKFRTAAGRRRLVAMLAKELTGEEIALSPDILEAIGYMLEEDAKQAPDVDPIKGVADGKLEFNRLLREFRQGRYR